MHFCKKNPHVWEKMPIEGAIHLRSHSIPLTTTNNIIIASEGLSKFSGIKLSSGQQRFEQVRVDEQELTLIDVVF